MILLLVIFIPWLVTSTKKHMLKLKGKDQLWQNFGNVEQLATLKTTLNSIGLRVYGTLYQVVPSQEQPGAAVTPIMSNLWIILKSAANPGRWDRPKINQPSRERVPGSHPGEK